MDKKIIITFGWFGIGGAQRRAFNLANNFAKNGYSVYVLAVTGNDSTIKNGKDYYNAEDNVNLVIIPEYYNEHKNDEAVKKSDKLIKSRHKLLKKAQYIFQPFNKTLYKINYRIKAIKTTNDLRAFLINHQGAVIINFGFNTFDKVYFSAKGLDFKIIYAETNASDKYLSDKFSDLTKESIKRSASYIFQTHEEANDHGLLNSKKSHIIHNPIKSNLPAPYTGQRNKTIVTFCRLSRQKNLMLLVKAFEMFYREFPDYKLEIYADTSGSNNSEYKNEILSYISEKSLGNCISLLPPSSEIHSIVLKSAIFVSSSDYEGISNSMIEAMAIGLPCVCTDCGGGGAREMITDGENGLLVPVGDAEALKNAMVRMIDESGLAEKCSKNAAEIRKTDSIERISEKWLEVINNI